MGSVSPGSRTRISVASSTTWELVRISPSADTTTPVPTDFPAGTSALIVTTDGPTDSATSRTARRPADPVAIV